MRVEFSKDFMKSVKRLSGKMLQSFIGVWDEVKAAEILDDITNCKKIESFNSVYRIRIGDKRAFSVLHVEVKGDLVRFEYLVSRGEAYDKKNMERLRKRDV